MNRIRLNWFRLGIVIMSWMVLVYMVACGPSAKTEDNVVESNDHFLEIENENKSLKEEISALKSERDKIKQDYQNVLEEKSDINTKLILTQKEYDEYKEKMSVYEELSVVEAQAKEVEARRVIEEAKARQAAKEAEEKERQEAEARKGYDTGITYDQLNRYPEDYKNQKVKFNGYVVYTFEKDTVLVAVMATSGKDKDLLLVAYEPGTSKPRIFNEDTVTVCGTSAGLYRDESNSELVLPTVIGESIEVTKGKTSTGTGKSSAGSGGSSTGKPSTSDSKKNTTTSNAKGYQEIYDEYAQKIKDATPRLINEYNSEAAGNTNGIMGLAEIHNNKLGELAAISTEGVEKMASYMYTNGGGNYAEYQEWSTKLYSLYLDEGAKITNAYMSSCYGALGF